MGSLKLNWVVCEMHWDYSSQDLGLSIFLTGQLKQEVARHEVLK